MDPSRTLGRGGGPGESWPLPRALPHLPGIGVQTHEGRTGPGLSPEEASLPLPRPHRPPAGTPTPAEVAEVVHRIQSQVTNRGPRTQV